MKNIKEENKSKFKFEKNIYMRRIKLHLKKRVERLFHEKRPRVVTRNKRILSESACIGQVISWEMEIDSRN